MQFKNGNAKHQDRKSISNNDERSPAGSRGSGIWAVLHRNAIHFHA